MVHLSANKKVRRIQNTQNKIIHKQLLTIQQMDANNSAEKGKAKENMEKSTEDKIQSNTDEKYCVLGKHQDPRTRKKGSKHQTFLT